MNGVVGYTFDNNGKAQLKLYDRAVPDMNNYVRSYEFDELEQRIPEAPWEEGTYVLKVTVNKYEEKTYSWVAE